MMESTVWNPQWGEVVSAPALSLEIASALEGAGLCVEPCHTGGGCMALEVTLAGSDAYVLVTDGDAAMPGDAGDDDDEYGRSVYAFAYDGRASDLSDEYWHGSDGDRWAAGDGESLAAWIVGMLS